MEINAPKDVTAVVHGVLCDTTLAKQGAKDALLRYLRSSGYRGEVLFAFPVWQPYHRSLRMIVKNPEFGDPLFQVNMGEVTNQEEYDRARAVESARQETALNVIGACAALAVLWGAISLFRM